MDDMEERLRTHSSLARRAFGTSLCLMLGTVAACGDDTGPSEPSSRAEPALLAAVDPMSRVGTAGESSNGDVTVRVTSNEDEPLAGIEVAFEVIEGGGRVSATEVVTGVDGTASVTWTLGETAGQNRLRASVGSLAPVVFEAHGAPGPPGRILILRQPGGARAGTLLETQPVIGLADVYGNPIIPGDAFEVRTVLDGEAELTGTTTADGQDGRAEFVDLAVRGGPVHLSLRFEIEGVGEATSESFELLPPPRSDSDRLDEVAGPQVHFIYALPADGEDRALDTGTELAFSIASFQSWLATKTGLHLRVDEFAGAVDIGFFRLEQTDAEMAANDPFIVTVLEERLREAGRVRDDKLYLVYYDGSSSYACGGASWPPSVPGQTAAMYLRGHPGVPCPSTFVDAPGSSPTYWEFAMLHDALHVLGIVSAAAPNHTDAFPAHVPEPDDLMYAGSAPWRIGPDMEVDIGGDDYFGPGVAVGLSNLAASPFIELADEAMVRLSVTSADGRALLRSRDVTLPVHPSFRGAFGE